MRPILNIADVPFTEQSHGDAYEAKLGQFGPLIGMKQLSCRLTVVPPGKKAWPYHSHHVNEEMFVILEGTGTLRYAGEDHGVKAGDVIACPAGGVETAHQLINTGTAELRYLAISTMNQPEVCEYPDSGKFAVLSGAAPGGDHGALRLAFAGRAEDSLEYWDGE
jgi:uncharacterized cupin superfamily protein